MSLQINQITKTIEKIVTEQVPTGEVEIKMSEPIYRRIGRVLLAHAKGQPAYHGPRTDAAVKEFVAGCGFTVENTAVR